MSKMYKRYVELKKENSSKIYLFKSGIFYIFLDDDAKKMSAVLNLRLTSLNADVLKCGFPVNNLEKYLSLLKNSGYDVNLVENINTTPISPKNYLLNSSIHDLLNDISIIKVDELSIKEAYSLLEVFCNKSKKILTDMEE